MSQESFLTFDDLLTPSVVKDFAVELHAEDNSDMTEEEITKLLQKAGGANYGSSSS